MTNDKQLGLAGTVAGLGLAIGGLAFGAFLSQRRKGGDDDAPFYTRKSPDSDNAVLGRTVTIRKPRAELYAFWRDFRNLPRFMENVETIRKEGDHRVWVIKAPAGQTVEIKTEVCESKANASPGARSKARTSRRAAALNSLTHRAIAEPAFRW